MFYKGVALHNLVSNLAALAAECCAIPAADRSSTPSYSEPYSFFRGIEICTIIGHRIEFTYDISL